MFTIYKAQTAHLAAEAVVSMIKGEGRHVVIAPDPFTLAVEKTISSKLGKKAFFNIEVMSFARLASVFLGESVRKCLSPAGSVMLMEKVIHNEKPNLLHYQKAAGKPGFAAEIYAAITSIRNSGVTPQALYDIEGRLKGYVKAKTHDIAHLYEAYLTELNLNHTDSTTRLEALVESIKQSEDIGDVSFYVVDHVDLNAKQLEVLSALMTKARSLSVAVADGAGAQNGRIYPHLANKLRNAAKEQGVEVKEVFVPSDLSDVKRILADELFSYSFSTSKTDRIRLWEAKDREEEVTLLATEIVRLVRKEGRRYQDVAVITPSFEEYLPTVERVFRAYDIPFFADRRVPLSLSDVFRHLMLAMEIPLRGYDKTCVEKYILHSLFNLPSEHKAAFFDYVDKSGADQGYFKKKFNLFEDDPLYPIAEEVRSKLCEELKPFEGLPKAATVAEYAGALRAFLKQNDFDGKVAAYLNEVCAASLSDQAEIIRQVPSATMELLDTLTELRGEETVELKDFIIALSAGAGQIKIATLPVSLDCVYFAPVKQAMYVPIPALFVLGAEEGLFPLETVGEGILGATEYSAWQDNNIKIENTGIEELTQSRFHAVQLLLRGENTYLSHVESNNCSPCFLQIKEIFSLKIEKCADALKKYDADVLIPTEQVAKIALVEYSRRYHEGLLTEREMGLATAVAEVLGKTFPLPFKEDRVEKVDVKDLFFRKGMTSVSELETYFKCPFLHFVKYGLGAREKDVVAFEKNDVGIVAHECMQRFVEKLKRTSFAVSDEKAREMAKSIAEEILSEPKYEPVRREKGERAVARAIRRCQEVAVTVKNQILNSEFRPTLFEKRFPERQAEEYLRAADELPRLSSVKVDGVSLTGQIDRVDVLKEDKNLYAAAFDYKTGSAKISSSDLFVGKKIQLPLYLAVLKNSGYQPVAALYYSLSDHRTEGEQVLFGPKLIEEKAGELPLVQKLDGAISADPSPYTGVAEEEDGSFTEDEDMLLSEGAFRAQVDYALDVASGAVREIKDGFIRPSALQTGMNAHCAYCAAKNVCRHAGEIVRASESVTSGDIYSIEKTKDQNEKTEQNDAD